MSQTVLLILQKLIKGMIRHPACLNGPILLLMSIKIVYLQDGTSDWHGC